MIGRAILMGGLAAGVLDLAAAFTIYALRGVGPVRIAQAIASGLLGASAFQGGVGTAALGVVLHFVIAFGATAVYVGASRVLPVLRERAVPAGLAYGVIVWAVMSFVVLPLSAVAQGPFDPRMAAIMIVVHMACVGLPIALATRRYSA